VSKLVRPFCPRLEQDKLSHHFGKTNAEHAIVECDVVTRDAALIEPLAAPNAWVVDDSFGRRPSDPPVEPIVSTTTPYTPSNAAALSRSLVMALSFCKVTPRSRFPYSHLSLAPCAVGLVPSPSRQ
jgi:hypothetical protein